ncbi:hypothetical protein [Shimia sp.]|uniref:hypothetical protein n=1 Tax=Shimia sp. TaxID=1954381 RepID=UPI0035670158
MKDGEHAAPCPQATPQGAQRAYARARITKRLDPELGSWLRAHLDEVFNRSHNWAELGDKLRHRGFYLKRGDGHLWLSDCHSQIHICSCSFLGHPCRQLESKFGERFH